MSCKPEKNLMDLNKAEKILLALDKRGGGGGNKPAPKLTVTGGNWHRTLPSQVRNHVSKSGFKHVLKPAFWIMFGDQCLRFVKSQDKFGFC